MIAIGSGASAQAGDERGGGLQVRWIAPQSTDPQIDQWLQPHYVAIDAVAQPKGKLFLHFPGSNAVPSLYRLIVQTAASEGYHAIGLRYPNSWSVNEDLCAANVDRDCHEKVRRETLTGDDHSSLISVNRPNSIENRLIKLLQYLDANYPQEGWGSFLDAGALWWPEILVGGHSQGGGHAAFIAKEHVVARVLMFAGGPDYSTFYGGLAPWLFGHVTPSRNYLGFVHVLDSSQAHILTWNVLGVIGSPYDVANQLPPYDYTHQLVTTVEPAVPGEYHGSVVADMYTPLDGGGQPVYLPVWRYMLTPVYAEGDLNCDGLVNTTDVSAFVTALLDPAQYDLAFMGCPFSQADLNGNGDADGADIAEFIGRLTQ